MYIYMCVDIETISLVVYFHISCMRHADEANSGASAAYTAVNSDPERCLHRFMHLCRAEFEMGTLPINYFAKFPLKWPTIKSKIIVTLKALSQIIPLHITYNFVRSVRIIVMVEIHYQHLRMCGHHIHIDFDTIRNGKSNWKYGASCVKAII